MVKIIFFGLIFLFLLVNIVSAVDTEIQIKTMPYHEVHLSILDPTKSDFFALATLKNNSDQYGDASFVYAPNETTLTTFDLAVVVKKGSRRVLYEQIRDNFPIGEPIYLELVTEGFEIIETPIPEENKTEDVENLTTTGEPIEEIEQTESEEKIGSLISSFVVGEGGILSGRTMYYIGGGVILLILVSFVVFKNKTKIPKEIRVKKLSELKKEKEEIEQKSDELKEAERKLKEAQEQVNQLKNKDKIAELKKRIVEDEAELIKLRKGED